MPERTLNMETEARPTSHSYRGILKATSILGGASVVNMLVGVVRSKVAAQMLGPAGVGLIGTFQSLTALVTMISCMGLNTSGVREVAAARGSGDPERLATTLGTFKWLCVVFGATGALALVLLSKPVALLTFESPGHAGSVAALAAVVFCSVVLAHNSAVIQGWQSISSVAKLNVWAAIVGVMLSVACFVLWRQDGIVPALIAGSASHLLISLFYIRKLGLPPHRMSLARPVAASLLKVGGMFVFFGVASAAAAYIQRLLIVRQMGENAAGMFQAATALSVIYATYVLNAMSTDFLPRLSAVAHQPEQVNHLVNTQTVVGVLLGLPGIVATNAFARIAMPLFYSAEFQPAIILLQWMALGVFGKIISWPLGIALVARVNIRFNVAAELGSHLLFFTVLIAGMPVMGLKAAGIAPVIVAALYTVVALFMVRRQTRFVWDARCRQVLLVSAIIVGLSLGAGTLLPQPWDLVAGAVLLACSAWYSYRILSAAADITPGGVFNRVFKRDTPNR